MASLPLPATGIALLRPVCRVCGEGWENAEPPGRGADGEKKKVPDKERGSRSASRSVHTAPQCGSGQRFAGFQSGGQRGGTF